MKKKPELDDVDIIFDPTPLTVEEKRLISEYIRKDQERVKNHRQQPILAKNKAQVRAS